MKRFLFFSFGKQTYSLKMALKRKVHVNLLTGGRPQDESYPSWNRPNLSLSVSVCASEDESWKGGANLGWECNICVLQWGSVYPVLTTVVYQHIQSYIT